MNQLVITHWDKAAGKGNSRDIEYGVPFRFEYDSTKISELTGQFYNSDPAVLSTCLNFDALWVEDE